MTNTNERHGHFTAARKLQIKEALNAGAMELRADKS